MKTTVKLPDAAIELSGFPLCSECRRQEVPELGDRCADHGGEFPNPEILTRTLLRMIRKAVEECLSCCGRTKNLPCQTCIYTQGAIFALAGIIERIGKYELSAPFMGLLFDPVSTRAISSMGQENEDG